MGGGKTQATEHDETKASWQTLMIEEKSVGSHRSRAQFYEEH